VTRESDTLKGVTRRLVLNVAPILFEDGDIAVEVHPYSGKEHLDDLRERTRTTHVVRRDGGQRILCAPTAVDALSTGGAAESVRISRHLGLAAELVRDALLNYVKTFDRVIIKREPISFLADGPSDELLGPCLPAGAVRPPWLSCHTLFEVTPRRLGFSQDHHLLALAPAVRTRRVISANCKILLAAGISPLGLYVGRLVPQTDARLAPRFELAGKVAEIAGGQLLLDDARPGLSALRDEEAFLDPTVAAFGRCLEVLHGSKAPEIMEALASQRGSLSSGDKRLAKLRRFVAFLGQKTFSLAPGVPFKVGAFLAEGRNGFPRVITAGTPVYVFDPTGARTSSYNSRGLQDYGPYSAQTFTPNRPRVCVVCQRALKGQVEQFLHKFFNGIPGRDSSAVFSKGLIGEYRLEGCTTEFFLTEGESADAYQRAAQHAIEFATEKDLKWDLALVQSYERTHEMPGPVNPYLVTKATFLAQNVPTQEFEIETAQSSENQLRYSLSNMALATYAKLNGVPWLLKASPPIAHELVIGLGSAQIGQGRLGDRQRVVGITTVFTGDGNYWLSNLSGAVSYDDYPQAVLSSLRKAVEHASKVLNWQPRDHIRLIFHTFKPFKDVEAEAVTALTTELGDYDVETAFIHVVEDHPYLLFDEAQPGMPSFGSDQRKGILAPPRGTFFQLDRREVLISLTGPKELKQPSDGIPRPLLLKLHRASTFTDLTYLSRQVFAFACHSWRSFLPAPRPVTILYSDLLARLLGRLETVPRWNPDCMLGRIGRTRWFL
jgi:hypothetical protein